MADRLTGADLKAYRQARGLTQRQAADQVGLVEKTWRTYEAGRAPVSRRVQRILERLQSSPVAVDQPGEIGGEYRESPPSDGAAGQTDLPPLAEPPDPADDDYVSIGGGKPQQISRLDHYARLELSILTLLAGKEIVYLVSSDSGRSERRVSHQPGIADLFPDADRAAIVDGSPRIAHAWVEWARTNRRVDAILSLMIVEGGFSGVVVATLPVVLTILQNHGYDPLGWISRQITPPASPNGNGAAAGVVDPDDLYTGPGPEFG